MSRKTAYWICQIGGWLFFVVSIGLTGIIVQQSDILAAPNNVTNYNIIINMVVIFVLGIFITHIYRYFIIRWNWIQRSLSKLILRVLVASIVCSVLYHVLEAILAYSLGNLSSFDAKANIAILNILSFSSIFLFWSLIYFLIHYIEKNRKAEIEGFKLEAKINEIELNTLKSQLNPHFLFNSMNSIRALIDENPEKAKLSVTQLSNILRNIISISKKKLIPLSEELTIVKDYLSVEHTRYEERLQYKFDIESKAMEFNVPPLMLQTLVENGIKHGISKLTNGGMIDIYVKVDGERLKIMIKNNGQVNAQNLEGRKGLGIENTRQRLALLYGDDASFKIYNVSDSEVLTELIIPNTQNNG